MLSIGKLAAGTGGYYTAMVASGAEEYYTGAREAPGRWTGQSAGLLGLDGEVTAEDFAALLEHRDPATGARVTAARSVPTVVAFDATFCAPKSVSILHGLGNDLLRGEVRDAHDAAVAAAWRAALDRVYAMPYTREWHPSYTAQGGIPALQEVRFSVTAHRGCY